MESPRKPAIFICRHGERVDYEWKARGENWQAQAERPWDSPLTQGGIDQGAACGRAIVEHCERLGLAPVRKIYISPLLRCAQTASAAAVPLGVKELNLCTALAETMSEDWYRSWGTPGADSTWGGSGENVKGKPVDKSAMHPAALGPSSSCFLDAKALTTMLAEHGDESSIQIVPTDDVQNSSPFLPYTWGDCESEEAQANRMSQFCYGVKDSAAFLGASSSTNDQGEESEATAPYSVLLVSHGGPTTGLYASLSGTNKHPSTGYTGLYAYSWEEKPSSSSAVSEVGEENIDKEKVDTGSDRATGRWKALIIANHDHLKDVPGATMSGPNDMVEQAELPEDP